jgi:hypothetical protein
LRRGLIGEQRPTDIVVLTAHSSPAAVSRELTRREREVLALMIDRAVPFDPDESDGGVEDMDRTRWRAQLRTARAGRPCGCGSCPSIELTDTAGVSPEMTKSRVVLGAVSDEAMLLLFIDDDQLSYLELAPTGDRTFAEFPDPSDIRNV